MIMSKQTTTTTTETSTWVGMAGLHGYMPNVCDDYETYEDAVEGMAQLHDLGRDRKRKLKRDGYLELNLERDGNEYISIEFLSES